jgi:hypothetical protein
VAAHFPSHAAAALSEEPRYSAGASGSFHDIHELPGIIAQPARYFPQVAQISRDIPRAIFHPIGEEFGPICYLGRIDKMSLS